MSEANSAELDNSGQLATSGREKMLFGHSRAGGVTVCRRYGAVVVVVVAAVVGVAGRVVGGGLAWCDEPQAATTEAARSAAAAAAASRREKTQRRSLSTGQPTQARPRSCQLSEDCEIQPQKFLPCASHHQ